MGRGGLLLLAAWVATASAARAEDPYRPLLLPPAPVKSTTAVRPVSHDESDLPPAADGAYADRLPPVRPAAPEPRDPDPQPPPPRPPAKQPARPRAAGLIRPEGDRTVPAHLVESADDRRPAGDRDRDGPDDFLGRRSDLGRGRDRDRRRADGQGRSSGKFGDKFGDLFTREDDHRGWFCSDHGFDQFASPVTNPFLFEDPRATTELRPVFIYQKVPGAQPDFHGGSLFFVGARGSVAFTERLSLTVNKIGGIGVYPGSGSPLDSQFGLSEIWLGPKVTIYRNPDAGTILSAGGIFQIPVGTAKVYQNTGSLSITPYVSAGQTLFRTRLGSINGLATGGYSFSVNHDRSDYLYASGHLDWDVCDRHRLYPLVELNWFQYTTNGRSTPFPGEGRDLINFGDQARGSNLLTWAIGGRVKVTESSQVGAAFELPLLGNRDLFQYRFTVDFIWRY